ncbi:MAG: hypothetical protein ACTSXG_01210 [Alphaproteobacteria bacterium]
MQMLFLKRQKVISAFFIYPELIQGAITWEGSQFHSMSDRTLKNEEIKKFPVPLLILQSLTDDTGTVLNGSFLVILTSDLTCAPQILHI